MPIKFDPFDDILYEYTNHIRISSILHFFQIVLPFDFYLYLYLYFNRYLFSHREIQKYNIIERTFAFIFVSPVSTFINSRKNIHVT